MFEDMVIDDRKGEKIWQIKCTPKYEQQLAISLLTKFAEERSSGESFPILGLFVPEREEGRIYVEAKSQQHVADAVNNFDLVFKGPKNIRLIPKPEIRNLLNQQGESMQAIKKGEYVRVLRGMYKDDLGLVVDLDLQQGRATVKLTPRVNVVEIIDRQRQRRDGQGDKKGRERGPRLRPTPALLDRDEVERLHGDIEYDSRRGCYKFHNQYFDDVGFLLRECPVMALLSGPAVQPSTAELKNFSAVPLYVDDLHNDTVRPSASSAPAAGILAAGMLAPVGKFW
eukprot:GHVU01029992.1.p1 GENE.GHVU01029992.1~~GHVU01029992.1.p1  ORF type:complete len:283 (-),score=77.24 GHVU01029992.1:52-900(-)